MHQMVVAMNVTDEAGYGRYRSAMAPVLARHGGRFAHDFRVAETLQTDAPHAVTRVFMLEFSDPVAVDPFFADPEYLAAKAAHYDEAVDGYTVLSAYETGDV